MAVTYDNDAETSGQSVSSLTINDFTVGDNSNRYLIVGIAGWDSAPPSVSSVSWKGDSTGWTELATIGNGYFSHLWGKKSPAAGTGDVVVTLTGACDELGINVLSVYNVDQTIPAGTPATSDGTSSPALVTITGMEDGDLIYDAGYLYGSSLSTPTIGANQTERANLDIGGFGAYVVASTQLGSAGGEMSWSGSGMSEWALAATALKPTSGNGGEPGSSNLHLRSDVDKDETSPSSNLRLRADSDKGVEIPTPNSFNKLAYTSEPPTPNAWNQLKIEAGTGWKKILYSGE